MNHNNNGGSGNVGSGSDEEPNPACGVFANGTFDYSEGGDNWCGQCLNNTF